ncbi:hypothetical protein [Aquamicrobium sp. LC103]|uniref:hypothetical protein n=1 Tax=Aquamicrobium sp. LC103 TaxID=1120658 RepID=UPI00063E8A6A|nr:hypothetical protein [Aquamicrobium sp. LC103]TKT82589.1 hypothetical protein XW59_001095 [Aquamicrobium sp. LC103]
MIRTLFRLLATIALAIAVIMMVIDATRSIAADAWVMTPLGESWMETAPASLERLEAFFAANLPGFLWDHVVMPMLTLPGFAVFLGLALILYAIGRRPRGKVRFALEN